MQNTDSAMTRAQPDPHGGRGGARAPKKKGDRGITAMIVVFAIILLGGVGLLVYPTFADWWNRLHASRAVAGYVEQVEDMSAERRAQMLEQARQYNARLNTLPDRWHLSDAELADYNATLDVTGTGIMGYVTIPKLKVQLPIYHGTEETVLQIAGGHLAGSSLPVGGSGVHTAVSGHTGLPSAKLFTGLDSLEEGDTFAFHVLDEQYTYQVDQIRVVLPTEMRDLDFAADQDHATLITCTPYGVNSHRLLVRGHRIANPVESDPVRYDDPKTMTRTAIAVAALVFLVVAAIIVWRIKRRRRLIAERGRHRRR